VLYIRDMIRGKWNDDTRRQTMQCELAEPEVERGLESAMNALAAYQELQREAVSQQYRLSRYPRQSRQGIAGFPIGCRC
jgi:hypothetical protein